MKTLNFPCMPVVEHNADTEGFISYSESPQTGPGFGWGVGIPRVRNKDGFIIWEPDSDTCCFWSIEGGGTVVARDGKGRSIEAYRLKPGETVEIV